MIPPRAPRARPARPAAALLLLALAGAAAAGAAPAPGDTLRPLPGPGPARPGDPAPSAPAPDGEGRGEREMVLVHGLGSSAAIWDQVVPLLSRTHRVWVYELPGHGRTPPIENLTIASAAADLGRFIEAHGLGYPVLVGHAMGGLVAMRYTFDHPAKVKRLIVIDAAPRQMATQEQKAWTVEQLLHNYDRFVADSFSRMSVSAEITRGIVDQALKTDRASFTSLLMSSFRFDLTEELPRQAVPILVIGSNLLFPEEKEVREQLDIFGFSAARAVNFKRLDRVGHFVMLEQPSYVASVIGAFALSE